MLHSSANGKNHYRAHKFRAEGPQSYVPHLKVEEEEEEEEEERTNVFNGNGTQRYGTMAHLNRSQIDCLSNIQKVRYTGTVLVRIGDQTR